MTRQRIREFYAAVDWSRTDFSKENEELARNVLRLLGNLPGRRILDLGCGSASLAVELAARGFDVSALDIFIAPAQQRVATRRANVRLVEQDVLDMDFHEEFDAVINWDVSGIGLFPSDEQNIDIVVRVHAALVPGGKFLVETYNLDHVRENPGTVEGLIFDPATKRCVVRKLSVPSIRLFSLDEWKAILADTGFEFLGSWASLAGDEFSLESKMLVVLGRKLGGDEQQGAAANGDKRRR